MSQYARRIAPVLFVLAACAMAQTSDAPDKTLSPYFFVQSNDASVDQLPLLSTSATVDIAGVIADVKVTQVYKNEGKKSIEAVYVFPASTRAAVYAMKMTIGDRTIVAQIRERGQARAQYEQAKAQGKTASLLEQERPNVFQMNVANVMPDDFIRVELSYTELLEPTDGVYEFVYPTVVGPRYSNVTAQDVPMSEKWVASPYTHEGEEPLYDFGITVSIAAGLPIQNVTCESHKTSTTFSGLNDVTVRLDKSEKAGGNRDFILHYRLAGGRIESGLILHRGADENFFLLMLQPPKRVELAQIPPREYIFIMDVSGSMNGYPIDISKKLLRNLIANLRPTDRFNIIFFAASTAILAGKSLPATSANSARAMAAVDAQRGGGGTEILDALRRALSLPRTDGVARSVVIATDGYVRVEPEAFDVIRQNLGKANMFTFGIGTSVNRHIIEGMAHVGLGESFVVEKQEKADAEAERLRKYIESPVLTQMEMEFPGFDVYDVEPPSIPDVLADRPIIVYGKWRGENKGAVIVRGWTASGKYTESINVAGVEPAAGNSALRYLWARQRIRLLDDYNGAVRDTERTRQVTELGLKYSLLTEHTSFVAIDTRIRNQGGKSETVDQPLPLPQGVSDLALPSQPVSVGLQGGVGSYTTSPSVTAIGSKPVLVQRQAVSVERIITDDEFKRLPATGISDLVRVGGSREPRRATCKLSSKPVNRARPRPNRIRTPKPVKMPPGTVVLGQVLTTDSIITSRVTAAVSARLTEINWDYAMELSSRPKLKGKVLVSFVLQPGGAIREVAIVRNDLTSEFGRKLVELLKTCRFLGPSAGDMEVSVQLDFKP